jgi:predicted ATPase
MQPGDVLAERFLAGREPGQVERTLLGKATPCVGRDRELRILNELFGQCVEDVGAQAVLVTAQAGVGKSRLGREFLRGLRARGDVAIWAGRGDPLGAGSVLGLLGQAIRSACGIRDGEPLEGRQRKLVARVERIACADRQRLAELLGEIAGISFRDAARRPLPAALFLGEHLQKAFLEFLQAACEEHPIVIFLEDLHWGDLSTVQFLDRALRHLSGKPLFILALARPDVHSLFPDMWREHRTHELRLRELGKRSVELLAHHILGERVGPSIIHRMSRLSEGNAFYLEELIRATAEGKGAELPATLSAMVQSRLGAIDEGARRMLQAASVFGEVFWAGAVASLPLGEDDGRMIPRRLAALVEQELVQRHPESRFPGEEAFTFRHSLLREGAYATMTEDDRALWHRLAGEWLEQKGEQDPLVLAEHFEKGSEGSRAARYYVRVAEMALRAGQLDDAEALLASLAEGPLLMDPDRQAVLEMRNHIVAARRE